MARVKAGQAYISVKEKKDDRFTLTVVGRTANGKPFTAVRSVGGKEAVLDFIKEVRVAGKRKGINKIPVRREND